MLPLYFPAEHADQSNVTVPTSEEMNNHAPMLQRPEKQTEAPHGNTQEQIRKSSARMRVRDERWHSPAPSPLYLPPGHAEEIDKNKRASVGGAITTTTKSTRMRTRNRHSVLHMSDQQASKTAQRLAAVPNRGRTPTRSARHIHWHEEAVPPLYLPLGQSGDAAVRAQSKSLSASMQECTLTQSRAVCVTPIFAQS